MTPQAHPSHPTSALYRRVWRWHFYAGLVCLPFLLTLALTGALYLFKEPIESSIYAPLRSVEPSPTAPLDAESLVAQAQAAEAGEPLRFVAAERPGRSAEVGLRSADGHKVTVYLDPATGRVLGRLRDETKLMEVVKHLHSLAIAGTVANHAIEVVAGWSIVLVISGLFLWWPRGRSGGVCTLRGRPAQRTWWRDLHAVTGAFAAAAILFLAVTGMPWSAFWGHEFGRITNERGWGVPKYLWNKPPSGPVASNHEATPWTLSQAVRPSSDPHAGHAAADASTAQAAKSDVPAPTLAGVRLNDALKVYASLGLPPGTPVGLPIGPRGVYTATRMPDDVRHQRVVHLDRYSGAILADVDYAQYGPVGRLTEWGISLHTGRQFGWVNQLVMLAGCLSIVALAISAGVMWWKRRPRGRLAAPPRRRGERAAFGAIAVAVLLGLIYPLLGASMLVAVLIDGLVPQRWHERFAL